MTDNKSQRRIISSQKPGKCPKGDALQASLGALGQDSAVKKIGRDRNFMQKSTSSRGADADKCKTFAGKFSAGAFMSSLVFDTIQSEEVIKPHLVSDEIFNLIALGDFESLNICNWHCGYDLSVEPVEYLLPTALTFDSREIDKSLTYISAGQWFVASIRSDSFYLGHLRSRDPTGVYHTQIDFFKVLNCSNTLITANYTPLSFADILGSVVDCGCLKTPKGEFINSVVVGQRDCVGGKDHAPSACSQKDLRSARVLVESFVINEFRNIALSALRWSDEDFCFFKGWLYNEVCFIWAVENQRYTWVKSEKYATELAILKGVFNLKKTTRDALKDVIKDFDVVTVDFSENRKKVDTDVNGLGFDDDELDQTDADPAPAEQPEPIRTAVQIVQVPLVLEQLTSCDLVVEQSERTEIKYDNDVIEYVEKLKEVKAGHADFVRNLPILREARLQFERINVERAEVAQKALKRIFPPCKPAKFVLPEPFVPAPALPMKLFNSLMNSATTFKVRTFTVKPRANSLLPVLGMVLNQVLCSLLLLSFIDMLVFGRLNLQYFIGSFYFLVTLTSKLIGYGILYNFSAWSTGKILRRLKHLMVLHEEWFELNSVFTVVVEYCHVRLLIELLETFTTLSNWFFLTAITYSLDSMDAFFSKFGAVLSVNDTRRTHVFTECNPVYCNSPTDRFLSHSSSAKVLKLKAMSWHRESFVLVRVLGFEFKVFKAESVLLADSSVYNELVDLRVKSSSDHKIATDYVAIKFGRSSCFEKIADWQVGDDPQRGGLIVAHAMAVHIVQSNHQDLISF